MARQIQLESQIGLRATGQQHLEAAAKDLDNLQLTLNTLQRQSDILQAAVSTLQSTVAGIQATLATINAAVAAGIDISAVVGNSTQSGTSALNFTKGILTSFAP